MTENTNPLKRYYRQPQISIQLPSKSRYYAADVVETTTTGEHPVLPMTAIDELAFRTPDSMMNGQATVDVIHSCIPTIQDPWQLVNYDIDTVLIAVRIASYGETIDVTSGVPGTNESATHTVSLPQMLEQLRNIEVTDTCELKDGLKITVSPLTYKQITESQLKTFEQQRIFSIVNDENISDEEKIDKFSKSFVKLTELTVDIVAGCISKIETPTGSTDDHEFIMEFINNCPRDIFDKISQHISDIKETIELKPQDVVCTHCNTEYILPITMDQSNFFAVRS